MALELNGSTGVNLIQDGTVTSAKIVAGAVAADDLSSTLDLTGKTVTLPSGVGGKVLQYKVSQHLPSGDVTISSTSATEISSNLRISFTPLSASNRIICKYSSSSSLWSAGVYLHFEAREVGGSRISGDMLARQYVGTSNTEMPLYGMVVADGWSGAKTISVYAFVNTGSAYLNWNGGDTQFNFEILEIEG